MKKQLIIGASLALPICAFAQASVTLYGRINVSANYQSYAATATKPEQHGVTLSSDTSWWGMRGVEDLGGGNRAYFKLEGGFQVDTGSQSNPSSIFNRETYAGLGSDTFGSIQAGSQYSPSIFISAKVDPFIRSNVGAQFSLLQAGGTGVPRGYGIQYQNAVQYISPTIAGITARALISAAEGSPNGASYAGSLEYANGPLYVGFIYDQVKVASAAVGLAPGAPVEDANYSFAAAYKFSFARVGGWYETNHIDGAKNVTGWMLGATIPVGEVSDIRTSFAHRNQQNANASLLAAGYFYKLSKRTEIYTAIARLENSGTASFGIWPIAPPNPDLGNPTNGPLAPGRDVKAFQVGMLHVF